MVISKKYKTKKILFFVNFFLFINVSSAFAKCINNKCFLEKNYGEKSINLKKFINKKTSSNLNSSEQKIWLINNNYLKNILTENDIRLDNFIDMFTANNYDLKSNEKLNIDIESDRQYRENNTFYAEGNVIFYLKNGILKSDKFSYDQITGEVRLIGNISFEKGKQYFKASLINYNFKTREGEIIDVAGILSFRNLQNDLNLYPLDKKSAEKAIDLLNRPGELELLNTKNVRLNNILGLNADLEKISNWKFKSDRIAVSKNLWQSKKVEFTNDPFEKSQFIVESRNFNAEIINDKYKFTSKSTYLIFENKLRIPVGNRTISDEGTIPLKLGVGYDLQERDGFYIYRTSESYKLFKNIEFSYTPYFLVQRALRGKSKAFRRENASFLDEKVLQEIDYLDYLSLDGDIKANIFDWKSNINISLGSLNPKRLNNDSFSVDGNILKKLYSFSNNNEKFDLTSGFYGAYLKDDIYTAYGTKLLMDYSKTKNNVSDNYSLIFDIGNYQSKSLDNKKLLLGLNRYGINASWNSKYKLFDINEKNHIYDSKFNKPQINMNNALFLNTKVSTSAYQYNDGKSQSIFLVGIGPSITLGNLKNDFFDYSYLSLIPEFIVKKGKSPFAFDDFNSHSRVKLNLKQQLYGPILLGFSSDFIISNKSENYAQFSDNQYTVDISRRAYNLSFYYKNNQSFGLIFNIFNFGTENFDKTSI